MVRALSFFLILCSISSVAFAQDHYDPGKWLVAPFADEDVLNNAHKNLQQGPGFESPAERMERESLSVTPLDQRHRTKHDISEWLMMVVAQATTFTAENFNDDLGKTKAYFDETGRKAYADFFRTQNLMQALQSETKSIRSFVEEPPFLIAEGPAAGRYHWLYEVPVMISVMDRGAEDYKNAAPVNKRYIVTVQVGRSKDAPAPHGILIESWSAKPVR